MANHSFEIKTPQDFFRTLLEQYEEFKLNPLSSRHAILCAILCEHLREWVYKAIPEWSESRLNSRIKKTGNRARFDLFQELCNGSKHVFLDNSNGKSVSDTFEHKGDYHKGDYQSEDYDTSRLQIELKEGENLNFETELSKVIEFWISLFKELEINDKNTTELK